MNVPRWRLLIFAQAALVQGAWAGIRLVLGYRVIELGGGPIILGIVVSGLALPGLASAFLVGKFADRFGGSRVVLIGLVICVVGSVVTVAFRSIPILLMAAVLFGLGMTFAVIGNQTFVAHAAALGSRDGAFGMVSAAAAIGQMIAPPAILLLATIPVGPAAITPDSSFGILICGAILLAALPLGIKLARTERLLPKVVTDTIHTGKEGMFRTPGLKRALTVSAAVLVSVDLLFSFLPVWAVAQGVPAGVVGLLLSLRAGVSALSRFGLSRLIVRFGRARLLLLTMVTAAIALGALPFSNLLGAVVVMLVLGVSLGLPQPLTMTWAVAITDARHHGAVLGLRMSANRLAQLTVPISITTVAGGLGMPGIFVTNAVLLAGAALLTIGSNADSAPPGTPN